MLPQAALKSNTGSPLSQVNTKSWGCILYSEFTAISQRSLVILGPSYPSNAQEWVQTMVSTADSVQLGLLGRQTEALFESRLDSCPI
jgi:hypothetical protein